MSNPKHFAVTAVLASIFSTQAVLAAMVTDAFGNVGYDTAAECDAAVAAGTAKFYKPFSRKPSALREGETRVEAMPLKNLAIPLDVVQSMNYPNSNYQRGACDLGVGRQAGQSGVTKPLQGKYVPFSAEMPVNVYFNKAGLPVRATMQQCDNRFAAKLPRPIPGTPAAMKAAVAPALHVPPEPLTVRLIQGPVVPAPVQTAIGSAQGSIGFKEVLGVAGLLAVGAILVNNNTKGTTGTH